MNIFSPDLYRNFGIGFLAGAIIVAFSNGGELISAVAAIVR